MSAYSSILSVFHCLALNESRKPINKWSEMKRASLGPKTDMTIHPHYFNLSISPIIPVMGEDIVQSNHCRDWSVSFASLLIPVKSVLCDFSCTVSSAQPQSAQSGGVPLFSDSLHRSTLFVYFLQPVKGQYLDLRAPPHFHLQPSPWQTSINGARWGDNEAPRHRLTEVGEWQRHTELSLSHRNERRIWKMSEAASWTKPTEFGKLIPLCLE